MKPPSMKEETERFGISEETMVSMMRLFMETSVPMIIEGKRKEEERERQALDNANLSGDSQERAPMRCIRGARALVKYLESIDCPISESTIYRLVRDKKIPFRRPTPQVLVFDLDAIDRWLTSDDWDN